MKTGSHNNHQMKTESHDHHHDDNKAKRRRRCVIVGGGILLLLLLLFIIMLILALTVFKAKQPSTKLLSATVEGVSPRISFPVVSIQLNITLNLTVEVHNPNKASFKHGVGKSFVYYRGVQMGEAELSPGLIPSSGSEILGCRLTVQVDQLGSKTSSLISDIIAGQAVMDTSTRIPGRVTILRIIKKHAIAISNCRFTIAVPSMKIISQECKSKTKF